MRPAGLAEAVSPTGNGPGGSATATVTAASSVGHGSVSAVTSATGGDAGSGDFSDAAGGAAKATSAATESGLGGAANSSASAVGGSGTAQVDEGGPGGEADASATGDRHEWRDGVGRSDGERRLRGFCAGRRRPATAARPTRPPPRPLRPAARPTRQRVAATPLSQTSPLAGMEAQPKLPLSRRFSAQGIRRRAPLGPAAPGDLPAPTSVSASPAATAATGRPRLCPQRNLAARQRPRPRLEAARAAPWAAMAGTAVMARRTPARRR